MERSYRRERGAVCPATTIANPNPSAVFSQLTSDFLGFIAQLSAGGEAPPICWGERPGICHSCKQFRKNTNALIRSTGNGKINVAVTGAAAPAGTILPTTGVTLTRCGDTDNNLTDFAPIANGLKGQINWVLHNSQQILTQFACELYTGCLSVSEYCWANCDSGV